MNDLSSKQILAYGLVGVLLFAIPYLIITTPPCNGSYQFAIGGDSYLIFDCDNRVYSGNENNDNSCAQINCPAGQVCVDGKCEIDSSKPDLCANINCQNGGNCEDGTCKCPEGYTGTYCEFKFEKTTAIAWGNHRGGIQVTDRNISKTGSSWDADIISENYLPADAAGKIVHTINSIAGEYAIGFNNEQSSASPKDLDYGLQFMQEAGNRLVIYDFATTTVLKTVNLGDTVTIEKRKDGTVVFLHNGTLFKSFSNVKEECLYLDVKVKNMGLDKGSFKLAGGWGKGSGC